MAAERPRAASSGAGSGGSQGRGGGTRILVTDAQDRSGLAALRCLHAAGYRAGATATGGIAPGLWSRDCSSYAIVPDPTDGVPAFVAGLESALAQVGYAMVIPGRDETLYALSAERERLPGAATLGLPEPEVVMRALDKSCLSREAREVGIPTPADRLCERLDDALEAARTFGLPVLVKGVSTVVQTGDRLTRFPTRLVSTEAELRDAWERFGSCIVQRREPGAMMSFAGVATEDGLLASVVSRYARTFPPRAGQASFLETVEPSPWLSERVSALVAAIGWRGLFQLQLIESAAGVPMPIDFNPRLYGSMSIARAAGVPMTALWCKWVLGERPSPVTARPGIHYRMEDADARHILGLARGGDYRAAARAAAPRRHTTHAYFQLRDPAPLLARAIQLVQVRLDHRSASAGA